MITTMLLLMFPLGSLSDVSQGKMSLDGYWLFKSDPAKEGIEASWYAEEANRSDWVQVKVPKFWEEYPGLSTYDGWGWFARKFSLERLDEPMSIHFAGVDDDAVVWVNGIEVGSHTGYSDPFALDISGALRIGENTIVVQVMDYGGGGGIYKPITMIQTRFIDDLLKSEYFGKKARASAQWVREAVIYEVYLRSFSREGTFAGLEKRVPELKELGVTVLWLMPIHPVGIEKRKGTLGSPYAVRDYYKVNPEFGSMQDFRNLLGTVHRNGMKLIIDLVANHTSWDSKLIEEHPEWFTKDTSGRIISPNDDWTDVADLDFSHRGLWEYMINMMTWWVKEIGIDGFRCDVAELVPTEFWNEARRELDKIKPVMMLSEGSIPEHHMEAFDITYSWNVYDALEPLLKGRRPVALLDQIFKNESLQFPVNSLRMRFNTNHDKNAWDAPAVRKFGHDGLRLSAVLVNTIPGIPLVYTGEEVANDIRLDLFEKVEVDWSGGSDMRGFYKTLFRLRKDHPAITAGEMIRLSPMHDKQVYAFLRAAGEDKVLVVLNFSAENLSTSVSLPVGTFQGDASFLIRDFFDGRVVRVSSRKEIPLELKPYGYRVFIIE